MKAMVYTAPHELQLLDVDEPAPGADEVVLQVHAAGICGSELEGIRSVSPFRVPPLVMGHEFCGERLDTGERVVVNPIVSCGRCDRCQVARSNLCRQRQIVGIHRPGAFAERVAVPAHNLHALPADVDVDHAALVEPIANAFHAWRLVADRMPARVGIIGAGTIGLVSLFVAHSHGATHVAVSDRAPERLAIASRMGASATGTTLEGEFDVVIDAVGAAETRRHAVDVLVPGGATVWLGLHAEDAGFDSLALIRTEKAVLGSFAYTDADFRRAIEFAPTLDASWVSTFPLDDGVDIFTQLMNGRVDVVKALLRV